MSPDNQFPQGLGNLVFLPSACESPTIPVTLLYVVHTYRGLGESPTKKSTPENNNRGYKIFNNL